MTRMHPFLMFNRSAEEAMRFYVSVFPDARIVECERYGSEGPGREGSVSKGVFTVAGQTVLCTDNIMEQDFRFSPAVSFFIECETEPQLQKIFASLAERGSIAMPLDDYGFSRRFGWVHDRFGVSWQLNLAE